MKIIDLLNKIANGEEVPKKIKVDGKIYEYQGDDYGHKQDDNDNGIIINWLFTDNEIEKYDYISEFLNDKVEIIEEDKKIEKLENEIEFYSYSKYEELKKDVDKILYILKAINLTETKISNLNNKLNEIIDKVNSLEKKQ